MADNKKRLVLFVSTFPQQSETFIVSKFLGLLNRGWDVHIVCNHSNSKNRIKFPDLITNDKSLKRIHLNWPTQSKILVILLLPVVLIRTIIATPKSAWFYLKGGYKKFRWDVFRRFYLDAEIIRLEPDILHFEFGALAVDRMYLKDLLELKISVSFRGFDLNFAGMKDEKYYSGVWNKVDMCHFLGEALWERAQRRGCPENIPHDLIPPAVDFSKFPQPSSVRSDYLGTLEKPIRILSVGRLAWKKGYEYALHALKMLVDEGFNCSYHIIGSGSYQEALYFARHQLGIEAYVEFLGPLKHVQVIDYLEWPDVFLHPSISEGFCNAVLEAQMMGVPVVCTDAGGLRENVEHGVTGFVVPRRDPAAMAEKLALLACDGDLRQKMGDAGRKRVESKFNIEDQISAFEAFYDRL